MTWPTTLGVLGDLITAGQWNQLPAALAKSSGAGASYTFTSIPQAWTHLLIVYGVQTDSTNNVDTLTLRLNNDSGANYLSGYSAAVDSTRTSGAASTQTSIDCGWMPGVSAGGFGAGVIWIPNYAAAINHTVVSLNATGYGNSAGNNSKLGVLGGTWFGSPPAAVTSVKLTPNAGALVTNSFASLYGMGTI